MGKNKHIYNIYKHTKAWFADKNMQIIVNKQSKIIKTSKNMTRT